MIKLKKYISYLLTLLIIFSFSFCSNEKKSDDKKDIGANLAYERYEDGSVKTEAEVRDGIPNGLLKNYTPDGYLESVFTMKQGKREGPAVHYYISGQLKLKLNYSNNLRDGPATMYYKTGEVYRTMNYKEGNLEGIRKTFYKDGTIMAEAPYLHDYPGLGLKEYNSNGTQIKDNVILRVSTSKIKNETYKYFIEASLSEPRPGVEFFMGELTEGKYLHEKLIVLLPIDGRIRKVADSRVNNKIRITVRYQTNKSSWEVLSKEINL